MIRSIRTPRATHALLFLLSLVVAGGALAQPTPYAAMSEAELLALMPEKLPNPYLSLQPAGAAPDWEYWAAVAALQARSVSAPPSGQLVVLSETEPNDTQAAANVVGGFGSGADPAADVSGSLGGGDVDWFSVTLEAGDVLGATLAGGAGRAALFDPSAVERVGSQQDASFIYPPASDLPGGGNAVFAYVAPTAGTWAVRVDAGSGAYQLSLRVFRAPLESALPPRLQTVFVDFDGATVDRAIFGGSGIATLSPLATFLAGWGLGPADEDAVIDAILAEVVESVRHDVNFLGLNPNADTVVLNSRDHADPFPGPDVSRVIVGGTIPELQISTIGIAQSIDPGNFETAETGVVLLDLLSAAAPNPNSLNTIPRDPSATIFDLIGAGVGNIVSHEAGHYLGNFHTENGIFGPSNPSLMDRGGDLPNLVGVGSDGVFGTADDFDVAFGPDTYSIIEGFTGTENTLQTIAWADYCPDGSGGDACAPVVDMLADGDPLDSPLVVLDGTSVRFNINASDPDGLGFPVFYWLGNFSPVIVIWNFDGAVTANPLVKFNPTPLVTFPLPAPGSPSETFDLVAQVFDGSANSTISSFQVIATEAPEVEVSADGVPITGPLAILSGQIIHFTTAASDEDGLGFPVFEFLGNPSPISYIWNFDGGSGAFPLSVFTPNPPVTFTLDPGEPSRTFDVSVTVYDTLGVTTTVPITVNVTQ